MFCLRGSLLKPWVNIFHYFSNEREEEIEEYYRRKYAEETSAAMRFGEGGEEMSDEITQQTLLPGVK